MEPDRLTARWDALAPTSRDRARLARPLAKRDRGPIINSTAFGNRQSIKSKTARSSPRSNPRSSSRSVRACVRDESVKSCWHWHWQHAQSAAPADRYPRREGYRTHCCPACTPICSGATAQNQNRNQNRNQPDFGVGERAEERRCSPVAQSLSAIWRRSKQEATPSCSLE
jgi:hypothetical protein